MQKYFAKLKRGMAMFLAMLTLVGVMPMSAFAADSNGFPQTITCKNSPPMNQGWSIPGISDGDRGLLHIFTFTVNGQDVVAFCGDHRKRMNDSMEGKTYSNPKIIDNPLLKAVLSYYYFTHNKNSWPVVQPPISQAGNDAVENGWVQTIVWELLTNPSAYSHCLELDFEAKKKCVEDGTNPANIKFGLSDAGFTEMQNLAAARLKGYKAVNGSYELSDRAKQFGWNEEYECIDLMTGYIGNAVEGTYGNWTFAMYYPEDNDYQPMIVPIPPDADNPECIWAKVKKVDGDGNPLSGAEFKFSFTTPTTGEQVAGTATTGSDGYAYIQITSAQLGGQSQAEIFAQEIKAPAGYQLITTTVSGTGTTAANNERSTAVDLAVGGVVNTPPPPPGPPTDIIRKIDSRTKLGVGPATFHFEGNSQGGVGVNEAALVREMTLDADEASMSESLVLYSSNDFEMDVAGSTGFASKDISIKLTDGSTKTLKGGTAFTILSESGKTWTVRTSEKNGSLEGTVDNTYCMINMPDVLPSVQYKITNADSAIYKTGTEGKSKVINLDGVTGENLYGSIKLDNPRLGRSEYLVPIMYETAKKWAKVQKAAQADGDCLIVYDAYRPKEVQMKVKDAVHKIANDPLITTGNWKESWFISQNLSNHQRGIAADVSLAKYDGNMPSDMHDLSVNGVVAKNPSNFDKKDFSDTTKLIDTFKNNEGAMKLASYAHAAGLESLASEWWHFDDAATKAVVGDNGGGTYYVGECLSVAPDKAAEEGGTGSSASTPGGTGGGSSSGSGSSSSGSSSGSGSSSSKVPSQGAVTNFGSGPSMGYVSHDYDTDENGNLAIQWWDPTGDNYIAPGEYTVTEKSAPPGYNLDPTARHLTLGFDDEGNPMHSGNLEFENDPLRRIRIKKVSADGKPLAGAVFDIFRYDQKVGSEVTGDDGTFVWAGDGGLEDGYYTFVETSPPPGHLLPLENSKSIWLKASDIHDDMEVQLTFVNYEDSTIVIKKYHEGSTLGLPGATFEVMIEGEILGQFKSGPGGTIDITPETYGAFLRKNGWTNRSSWTVAVREIAPPDGYLLGDDQWQILELHQGETMKPFVFEDIPYPSIEIIKRDTNTRETLAGATFEVMIDGHSIGDYTTRTDGTIVINYETYKRFLGDEGTDDGYTDKKLFDVAVREKTAPEGYLIDDTGWQVKPLYRSQSPLPFEFNDTRYPEIWVRKIDHETEARLAGMTFEVEINGKKLNAQYTTREEDVVNNDGWFKIRYEDYKEFLDTNGGDQLELKGWTVAVTETSAPQFYNKDRQLGSDAARQYTIVRQLNSNSSRVEFTFEDTHYRSIKVNKVDAETNWDLEGAEFTLKCVSLENPNLNGSAASGGWGAGVSKQGVTNAQGEYVFENLPNGIYELTETVPPQGYHGINDTDSTKRGFWTDTRLPGTRTIQITSGSAADGTGSDASNRVLEYTYANEPKSGIKIFKKDGVTGHSIAGARFRITPLAPLEQASWEEVTDSNGLIVIENDLTYGSYMIEELEVPAPYHVDHTPQYVEIDDQHDAYSVTFNNYANGMVYIRKLDSTTGLPVAGARFEIRKADGTLLEDTLITGVDGYIDYGPLVPGESYVVTEIEAPPGFLISDPSVQTFTVPENTSGWVKSLIFKDDPLANLWLRKIDAETGLGLQGAVFEIRTGDGTIIRQNEITDQQGYIKVDGLDPGSYIVKETKAPIGYMLDDSEHHVVLKSGQTEIFLVENTKPGGLSIRKIDASTKQPLAGAVFQLYDINDKPIGAPVKTGSDGYARWADLEPGQYMVEEIEAPDGYQRTTERKKFEVKEFKALEYEWQNAEEATITIYKRDGETLLPLGGARFEIRKTN